MNQTGIIIKDARSEYKYFLGKYLLPLLGISYDNNLVDISGPGTLGKFIRQSNNIVYFSSYDEDLFSLACSPEIEHCFGLAQNIIQSFFAVSEYRFSGSRKSKRRNYENENIREENYKLAVQKGVCDWCAGKENHDFYKLLQILENWSVKTYEGNRVTLGFVFDPDAKPVFEKDDYGDWLEFLDDDYAATLTDCIHSVIRLDSNCNFAGYLSVTENNEIESYGLSPKIPYRFAGIIEKYITGSRVGVFLLSSGDILISKNKAVQLIKRNLKWLNLSYPTFLAMANNGLKKNSIPEDIIQEIYASVLDVSFAHTGGIIAVVSDIEKLKSKGNDILNVCDNLSDERSLSEFDSEMRMEKTTKRISSSEIRKRLLKRKIIESLVANRKFGDLDRKLRAELISMDGACIINYEGTVCAAGAIIRNDSGSSGGGRSAAAKKLSTYDGLAVKVSTDGYIELFVNYESVYVIK